MLKACPGFAVDEGGVLTVFEHGRDTIAYSLLSEWLHNRHVSRFSTTGENFAEEGDKVEELAKPLINYICLVEEYASQKLLSKVSR